MMIASTACTTDRPKVMISVPVEQELHIEDPARPEPEQPGRLHLLLRVRDEVDAALLDLERRVRFAAIKSASRPPPEGFKVKTVKSVRRNGLLLRLNWPG
jgi:hypothetical protein